MTDTAVGTPTVTDKRPIPRGVLPRHTQTWLMVGLAVLILGIIVLTGRPVPAPRPATTTLTAVVPSPDRLREYQDRLRLLDERARQQAAVNTTPLPPATPRASSGEPRREALDAIAQEQKRREYNSLFASNVVVSRRPGPERLTTTGSDLASSVRPSRGALDPSATPPSLDDVADAVMRATARHGQPAVVPAPVPPPPSTAAAPTAAARARPAAGPIASSGPLHRVTEGTVIDTVLTNRLDGAVTAPVNCLVTNPVYSYDGRFVLIPAGSRVLGETKPVQAVGETRLAVAFNRLVLPDGRTYPLEQFLGLNDIGDAGLRDEVNQHYRSTFGASAAVGLIAGFAQLAGSAALGRNAGTVVIASNAAESTAQATSQTMNRFLNRLPTITIREGHRVKVYLTNDVELPAYNGPPTPGALRAADK